MASVSSFRVLGVVLDDALSFARHASDIGERAAKCFGKVSRVSASSWGVRYRALRVIYRGTFVATVTYAASVWYGHSNRFVVKRALLRTQRPALILLTKAYRSVSTAALPVLAGVLPADLEVLLAGRVTVECEGLEPGRERGSRKRILSGEVCAMWQSRWDEATEGRELYSFFPSIAARLRSDWVEPDYIASQLLTGHGHFRARLHRMTLSDTPSCQCGATAETRDHALWECPLYEDERRALGRAILGDAQGPIGFADLVGTREGFSAFVVYARAWHERRKVME